jgi:Uma2 family endonuclease
MTTELVQSAVGSDVQDTKKPDAVPVAEYLRRERASDTKSEYYNGKIVAMTGASLRHNLLVFTILGILYTQFKGRSCRAFPSDMRVKVSKTGVYAYPDVIAMCDEPQLEDEHFDTLLNPNVIIEVLSPSTALYDRGEKFKHYRTIPSLADYVLVAQEEYRVEHYARKSAHEWLLTEYTQPDDVVTLASVDAQLRLADIYEKVEFPLSQTNRTAQESTGE